MAKLFFRYGAMGSSKTANAIMVQYNYQERGQKALMVKPRIDTRDGDRIVASRSGLTTPCIFMEELTGDIARDYNCIIVDCSPGRTVSRKSKPSAGAARKPPITPGSSTAKSSRTAARSCSAAMKAIPPSAGNTGPPATSARKKWTVISDQ